MFELCVGYLREVIADLAREEDASKLWLICRNSDVRDYPILVKLAGFPEVSEAVKDLLVTDLRQRKLIVGDLQDISKVDDQRIRQWFASQVSAPDPALRNLAKRVSLRGQVLPKGVELCDSAPDGQKEICSTETDLTSLSETLRRIGAERPVELPSSLKNPTFLSSVELNRWCRVKAKNNAFVWLRLDDIDTVEVVITSGN